MPNWGVSGSAYGVNICSQDIDFNISVGLISGTTMQIANIEAEGYTWLVSPGTGTPLLANIKLCAQPILSGGCDGLAIYRKMTYPIYAGKWQTLGDVSGSMDAFLIREGITPITDWGTPRVQMTNDYAFLTLHDEIDRVSLTGSFSVEKYYPEYVDGPTCMIDDNTILVIDWVAGVPNDIQNLDKVVFSGGATGTSTTLYSIENYDFYNGSEYALYDTFFLRRVKYGAWDCVVWVTWWDIYNDRYPPNHTFVGRCIIYNINTNQITMDEWFDFAPADFDPDVYGLYWTTGQPAEYKTKLVWIVSLDGWEVWPPGPPYDNQCLLPIIMIDVAANSVTRYEALDLEPDTTMTYEIIPTINYYTGECYFTAYFNSVAGVSDGYHQLHFNIDNPTTMTIDEPALAGSMEAFQSCYFGGVYVHRTPAPGNCNVLQVPSLYNVNTVYIEWEHNADYFESACAVDIPKGKIWNVRQNKLEGKWIGGGEATNQDITVNWGGTGNVPFKYAGNREVFFRILNKKAIIVVGSYASPNYQSDFYFLKEHIE